MYIYTQLVENRSNAAHNRQQRPVLFNDFTLTHIIKRAMDSH